MLESVKLQELVGYTSTTTGLDSLDKCLDPEHFAKFPHDVNYVYNSRGFRDIEWPEDHKLKTAVWCLGDSFTAGLGSPFAHTWPQVLEQQSKQRVINISMDGASNQWLSRKCCEIYNEVKPKNIIIMWSYPHRRELTATGTDLKRRQWYSKSTITQDYENLKLCRNSVETVCKESNIIELIIPRWQPILTHTSWYNIRGEQWPLLLTDLQEADHEYLNELNTLHNINKELLIEQIAGQRELISNLPEVPQLDFARDSHHFDLITSMWVAEYVQQKLAN